MSSRAPRQGQPRGTEPQAPHEAPAAAAPGRHAGQEGDPLLPALRLVDNTSPRAGESLRFPTCAISLHLEIHLVPAGRKTRRRDLPLRSFLFDQSTRYSNQLQ